MNDDDLAHVRRPLVPAVEEVQEGLRRPRALAPEERERDQRHRHVVRERRVDDLAQVVELGAARAHRASAPEHAGAELVGAQEQERRAALAGHVADLLDRLLAHAARAAPQPLADALEQEPQRFAERPVVEELDPVREAREPDARPAGTAS